MRRACRRSKCDILLPVCIVTGAVVTLFAIVSPFALIASSMTVVDPDGDHDRTNSTTTWWTLLGLDETQQCFDANTACVLTAIGCNAASVPWHLALFVLVLAGLDVVTMLSFPSITKQCRRTCCGQLLQSTAGRCPPVSVCLRFRASPVCIRLPYWLAAWLLLLTSLFQFGALLTWSTTCVDGLLVNSSAGDQQNTTSSLVGHFASSTTSSVAVWLPAYSVTLFLVCVVGLGALLYLVTACCCMHTSTHFLEQVNRDPSTSNFIYATMDWWPTLAEQDDFDESFERRAVQMEDQQAQQQQQRRHGDHGTFSSL